MVFSKDMKNVCANKTGMGKQRELKEDLVKDGEPGDRLLFLGHWGDFRERWTSQNTLCQVTAENFGTISLMPPFLIRLARAKLGRGGEELPELLVARALPKGASSDS